MKKNLPGRGEVIAMNLKELFERGTIDELEDFRKAYTTGSPADQRRLYKEVLTLSRTIADTKILTTSNDDVVNMAKHITIVCASLPMRG